MARVCPGISLIGLIMSNRSADLAFFYLDPALYEINIRTSVDKWPYIGHFTLNLKSSKINIGYHHSLGVDDTFGGNAIQREGKIRRC